MMKGLIDELGYYQHKKHQKHTQTLLASATNVKLNILPIRN